MYSRHNKGGTQSLDTRELVRLNVRIPKELQEWLKDEARGLGVTMSALVILGLQQYRQQKETVKMMKQMPEWLKQLQELGVLGKPNRKSEGTPMRRHGELAWWSAPQYYGLTRQCVDVNWLKQVSKHF